ncbi:hypothetical protein [Arthrobacter sp. UYCu712]|uniref:hypothetical protein n=1 Tax=Arthrobacter sp. UYCu712 TaxID=3156340 RepID=UPI0033938E88
MAKTGNTSRIGLERLPSDTSPKGLRPPQQDINVLIGQARQEALGNTMASNSLEKIHTRRYLSAPFMTFPVDAGLPAGTGPAD